MSKETLQIQIALLDLEAEIPEQKVQKNKTSRHMSEEFCKRRSEIMKSQWSDPEWRDKMLNHLYNMKHVGHPQTTETRKKMRASWTEERRKKQSETLRKSLSKPEVQEKLSNRIKGRHWWHKGTESTFSSECPGPDWQRGRAK